MRALIFNSGLGRRLGTLTEDRPKAMVMLPNGETIFERQLRILYSCGVREFVITTGPYAEQLYEVATKYQDRGCSFYFAQNDVYDKTNYIWSMWIAKEYIANSDILMLHGDLVFDAGYVRKILAAPEGSWGSVNRILPQPAKDFKARLVDGEIREVGVEIFDDDCFSFQAMYRLDKKAINIWLKAISGFIGRHEVSVYAENAANTVFEQMHVRELSYEDHVLDEVDTPEDLKRVGMTICHRDWMDQPVLEFDKGGFAPVFGDEDGWPSGHGISEMLSFVGMKRPFLVIDTFFADRLGVLFDGALVGFTRFSDYEPNPTYNQVLNGIRAFREGKCDGLISLGGGSAIDVAKCIRLWESLPEDGLHDYYADKASNHLRFPHIAIPTTAGTGAESTHFAVVYVNGEKRSIAHLGLQPSLALLLPNLLSNLPLYQKKATMMDALCQAIESYWSRSSSEESRRYSAKAIPLIIEYSEKYLRGDPEALAAMAKASNLAGKAINLTTTTAPHALSYKLSSLFNYAHGHAVALCMVPCWRKLLTDAEGGTREKLNQIATYMTRGKALNAEDGLLAFERLLRKTGLEEPSNVSNDDIEILVHSVNQQRLANFPLTMSPDEIRALYEQIVSVKM